MISRFATPCESFMTSLGYTVEAFPSAANFLASPFLAETACLVADVNMPGMTGPELHRHLVEAGLAIPTILVTAYPDDPVRDRALKDGVACYLYKPVDDHAPPGVHPLCPSAKAALKELMKPMRPSAA